MGFITTVAQKHAKVQKKSGKNAQINKITQLAEILLTILSRLRQACSNYKIARVARAAAIDRMNVLCRGGWGPGGALTQGLVAPQHGYVGHVEALLATNSTSPRRV